MTSTTLGSWPRAGGARYVGTAAALLAWAAVIAVLEQAGAPRVLLLLVLAPVLEEVAFRAGLHELLLARHWSPMAASGLTALTFAVLHVCVHGNWQGALVVFPALLIGATYNRWRQVRGCVLLHAAMNAVWLAVPLMNRAA